MFPRASAGDSVTFPVNNVEKCGNCLAVSAARDVAVSAAETACRSIFLRLAPNVAVTDDFLSAGLTGADAFPPDAFPVAAETVARAFGSATVNLKNVKDIPIPVPAEFVPYLDAVRDWQGRSLAEAIRFACRIESGIITALSASGGSETVSSVSLEIWWTNLLRGSVQGLVYTYDSQAN